MNTWRGKTCHITATDRTSLRVDLDDNATEGGEYSEETSGLSGKGEEETSTVRLSVARLNACKACFHSLQI